MFKVIKQKKMIQKKIIRRKRIKIKKIRKKVVIIQNQAIIIVFIVNLLKIRKKFRKK